MEKSSTIDTTGVKAMEDIGGDQRKVKAVSNHNEDKFGAIYIWGIVTSIIVLILWSVNWYWVGKTFCIAEGGQFGDRFGATTSLFGGITIVGLIITIILQRQEIKNGKEEFRIQNAILKYQRFDTTFFNMVSLHHQIIDSLPGQRQSFKKLLESTLYTTDSRFKEATTRVSLKAAYHRGDNESINTYVEDHFGQYINNFETTVEIVFKGKKLTSSRMKYIKIYFSQLTNLERIMLIYHLNLSFRRKPRYWKEFNKILFAPLHDSNQMLSAHLELLEMDL